MKQTANPPSVEPVSLKDRIKSIVQTIKDSETRFNVEGLHGASRAWFLAHLAREVQSPILVLTADQNTSETMLGDLKYFFRYEKVKFSPQLEFST